MAACLIVSLSECFMPHAAFQSAHLIGCAAAREQPRWRVQPVAPGLATPLRSAKTAPKGEIVHCSIYVLYRRQHPSRFLLCSAAIVLADSFQGQEAVPRAGRFL